MRFNHLVAGDENSYTGRFTATIFLFTGSEAVVLLITRTWPVVIFVNETGVGRIGKKKSALTACREDDTVVLY
tara:strand:+ start:64 stop:282 length:219 start_codon:yes stop_codon:yes gene_type:complete